MGQEPTSTFFSHIKPGDTPYKAGGLRDFFLYRDLGIAGATQGKVIAHLVKANMAPTDGTAMKTPHHAGLTPSGPVARSTIRAPVAAPKPLIEAEMNATRRSSRWFQK